MGKYYEFKSYRIYISIKPHNECLETQWGTSLRRTSVSSKNRNNEVPFGMQNNNTSYFLGGDVLFQHIDYQYSRSYRDEAPTIIKLFPIP